MKCTDRVLIYVPMSVFFTRFSIFLHNRFYIRFCMWPFLLFARKRYSNHGGGNDDDVVIYRNHIYKLYILICLVAGAANVCVFIVLCVFANMLFRC